MCCDQADKVPGEGIDRRDGGFRFGGLLDEGRGVAGLVERLEVLAESGVRAPISYDDYLEGFGVLAAADRPGRERSRSKPVARK